MWMTLQESICRPVDLDVSTTEITWEVKPRGNFSSYSELRLGGERGETEERILSNSKNNR